MQIFRDGFLAPWSVYYVCSQSAWYRVHFTSSGRVFELDLTNPVLSEHILTKRAEMRAKVNLLAYPPAHPILVTNPFEIAVVQNIFQSSLKEA